MSLQGKVAIVTGGSRGIGKSICHRLAREGACVVVNYVSNTAMANEVVEAIGSDKALAVQADAAKLKDMDRLVNETIERFGKLDIVVAAAGVLPMNTLDNLTEEEFDQVMDINVKGPMFLVQKASTHMQSGGRIMLFSSNLTKDSSVTPNYLAYCTSKGAIEQMTRLLSKTLAPRGIMINSVAPGPTATDMFLNGKSEQLLNMIKEKIPQKKIAEPSQIADVVAYLSGEGSSWISGQTITVSGGQA